MKLTTIKKLQQLTNKVCSVLTTSVAKGNFTDNQFADFFVGIVDEINEDGVWLRHPMTNCLSFFSINHVVAVLEEQVIDQKDEKYEEILTEVKKAPPEQQVNIIPVDIQNKNNSPYIDPDIMENLSNQAKEIRQKMIRK
ncbi:MAG: hypothetical protein EKK64_03255 [Neisseriaceae bacterium]|nr:MAG: hypothetical protein EKK64_03255 [Neisseriaceae bacterium]